MSDEKTNITGTVDLTTGANRYGGEVSVYGCQPATMDPPWTPPTGPWYPPPQTGTTIVITPATGTPLNPPKECKYCLHLFATVEAWNDHVEDCIKKVRRRT
ncbi:MAG: hypothetical protein WC700_18865 [Gemmatimonadaceae bacterium]|jgi:hypothetical protein